MADRAVVGDVLELSPVRQRHAPPSLLFVEEGLDQQRGAENLVARAVQQVGARDMGGAHRLAFAATQAVLDVVGDLADVGLFHDDGFVTHQVEARGVGVVEVATTHQLATVEAAFWIDLVLVGPELGHFIVGEIVELGDADAVFAGNYPIQAARKRHDAVHAAVCGLQHFVMIGVHR